MRPGLNRISFFLVIAAFFCSFASESPVQRYWVFFKDRGLSDIEIEHRISELRQRRKELGTFVPNRTYNENDLPPNSEYINSIEKITDGKIIVSRFLNAVSVSASESELSEIERLPFVKAVSEVKKLHMPPSPPEPEIQRPAAPKKLSQYRLKYGDYQVEGLEMHGIPELHEQIFDSLNESPGSGIRIALLDAGFDTSHPCFDSLNLIGDTSFVDSNTFTHDQNEHGTSVLSVMASYAPGFLIGGAYGAEYLLAAVEVMDSETYAEEDNWIAAAEWAELNGARIINSSVGYRYDFDDAGSSGHQYSFYPDSLMDGISLPISKAAGMLASKGIILCQAAGNNNHDKLTMISAPADAKDILSVGAVDKTGVIAYYSSGGPTYDGRIKPEICAFGHLSVTAEKNGGFNYSSTGTSYAAPMAAGAAALFMQMVPGLTAEEYINRIISGASSSESPDTSNYIYGHGSFNVFKSVNLNSVSGYVYNNWFSKEDRVKNAAIIYELPLYNIMDTAYSGNSGYYNIPLPTNLHMGISSELKLRIIPDDTLFSRETLSVDIDTVKQRTINIPLAYREKLSIIAGKVFLEGKADTSGKSEIFLKSESVGKDFSVNCDRDGIFLFSGVPDGTYSLICRRQGFSSYKSGIDMVSSFNVKRDVSLQKTALSEVNVYPQPYTGGGTLNIDFHTGQESLIKAQIHI
ncbi:MAG: S8 family serine peptidase, partial [Fibrobacterota bacterium]